MPCGPSAVDRLLEQLVGARVDELVRQLDLRLLDGGVEHRLLKLALDRVLLGLAADASAMSSRSSSSVSKPAASDANSSSSSGRRLALTSLTATSNVASLPAELSRVVVRERDLDVPGVAGARRR